MFLLLNVFKQLFFRRSIPFVCGKFDVSLTIYIHFVSCFFQNISIDSFLSLKLWDKLLIRAVIRKKISDTDDTSFFDKGIIVINNTVWKNKF